MKKCVKSLLGSKPSGGPSVVCDSGREVVAAHRLSAVANCDQLIDLATDIAAVAVIAK